MKNFLFWIFQSILFGFLALWFVYTLNYYQTIDLGLSVLPRINYDLATNDSDDLISKIPGFATVPDLGMTLIIFGTGSFILYLILSVALFKLKIISNKTFFWLNIFLYSIFIVAIVLGIIFIKINLY